MKKVCSSILLLIFLAIAAESVLASGVKVDGSLEVSNGGIVFSDGSSQTTATLQGPQGPAGPQGQQGPQGEPGTDGFGFKVYDSLDNFLGYYVSDTQNYWNIITDEGYRFIVEKGSGSFQNPFTEEGTKSRIVYFEFHGCSGTIYVPSNVANGQIMVANRSGYGRETYYVPNNSQIQNRTYAGKAYLSTSGQIGTCDYGSSNPIDVKELIPIDVNVTGFPNDLLINSEFGIPPLSVRR